MDNSLNITDKYKDLTYEEAINSFGKENVIDGFFTCKVCGKQTPLTEIKHINTRVVNNVVDATCKECRRQFNLEQLCKIVCVGCKEVIALVPPKKDPKTGFTMHPNTTYHIMHCPKCHPELFKEKDKEIPVKIIESDIYERMFGKPITITK